jgi:hypothetical protein
MERGLISTRAMSTSTHTAHSRMQSSTGIHNRGRDRTASGRGSPSKYKTRLTVRFPVFNFPPLLTVTGRAGCPSSSLSSLSDAASYLGTPIRVGELSGAFITDSAAVVSMPSSANCSATSGDLACAAETTARDHRSRANVCRGPISASPAVTSGVAHMVMS